MESETSSRGLREEARRQVVSYITRETVSAHGRLWVGRIRERLVKFDDGSQERLKFAEDSYADNEKAKGLGDRIDAGLGKEMDECDLRELAEQFMEGAPGPDGA